MEKRIIAFFLSVIFVVFFAVSCIDGKGESSGDSSSEQFNNGEVVSNGEKLTDYRIVKSSEASESESYAAEEFRKYFKAAAGVSIPIVTDTTEKVGNEIVIGQANREICNNVNYDKLGEEGYTLKTSGKDLLIAANETRGILYGVYSFLEKLGYRFYAKDVENIPSSRKVFIPKDLNETFVPRLEYRDISYEAAIGGDIAAKLKINTAFCQPELKNDKKYGGYESYVYNERGFIHTMRYLVNDGYITDHPEYFALWNGERVNGQWGGHCYSCEDLVDIVAPVALNWIKNDPESDTICISQNDGGVWCQCDLCMQNYEKYGKTGVLVRFINKVAKKIAEIYPDKKVELISYGFATEPPMEGTILANNVSVRLCMDYCDIAQHQKEGCEDIAKRKIRYDGWTDFTDDMRIYMYRSDYWDWFSVLPNVYSIYDEIKFFTKSNAVKGLYNEGYLQKSPEFGELRTYITAKLMWNPNMTKSEFNYHVDDFLQGYYGDGWENIKEYIQFTEKIASDYTAEKIESGELEMAMPDIDIYIIPYRFVGEDYLFFPVSSGDLSLFAKWNELWDKAEEKADEEQLERIKISRIAPMFFELSYSMDERYENGSVAEKSELVARNKSLYQILLKYGITQKAEHDFIKTDVTDFTKSPSNWVYKK